MDASELAPFFSGFFFGVLRTLAELRSADCRCGTERVRMSPFFLRKNRAGSRCGGPPWALPHMQSAGLDGCAVRVHEVRRKRERRPSGRACSHPWNPLSFSYSLPKQANPKTAFRVGFRGTKSAAALWQIKADVVPMRHRAQKVLAFCATMPN